MNNNLLNSVTTFFYENNKDMIIDNVTGNNNEYLDGSVIKIVT